MSLAALEILIHLKGNSGCGGVFVLRRGYSGRPHCEAGSYPTLRKSRIEVSRAFGNAWLEAKIAPALRVPTILAPCEWNVLLNPLHPQFSLRWRHGTRTIYLRCAIADAEAPEVPRSTKIPEAIGSTADIRP
jgi:hypothetical protein